MVKKHQRRSQQHPQGAILSEERPIHISNLSILSPVTNKATRIKTTAAADGTKQRVTAKEKALIS
jgi:large subunit ribosomal protein L24